MSYPVVDLTNCDKEPIHILGKVQSYGFLVAADKTTFNILYASRNIADFTGMACEQVLKTTLPRFLEEVAVSDKKKSLFPVISFAANNNYDSFNPLQVTIDNRGYNLIVHVSGNCVVLEFEREISQPDDQLQAIVGATLSKILVGESLNHMLDLAAEQIRDMIGYDRVMIYKFWDDGHGEVIAERKNAELEPFLGLHYPASDIPKQARELYKINLTRIIADVNATPSEILSVAPENEPLDLTHSTLRAVSSIHIEYLKNMGVMASFSVSLMLDNELWGLIACHNYSPRFIDYRTRQYAKLVGQVLSSSLQYRIDTAEKEINNSYRRAAEEIVSDMHRDWSLVDGMINKKNNLLKITSAHSAALVFEGKVYQVGNTPDERQIASLTSWIQVSNNRNLFYTNNLSDLFPPAKSYKEKASGLLACAISRELGEYVLFFKPEIITTVKWAGDPNKPVEINEKGAVILSPRRSFEVWSQEVRGMSEKWSNAELNTMFKFREDIFQFITLKSNEIRKLNEKLKEAYDELDTFSFTISHDLKTPIASIKNYSEILLEDNPKMDEQSKHFLKRIITSADKMNALIREVLGYSRVSRQQLNTRKIVMAPLLEEIKTELIAAYQPANLEFTIGPAPDIVGDKVMITQVFSNLLGNAIKYSSKADPAIVRVEGKEENGNIVYSVADNGIGIDMEYGGHIFELFKRMENVKDYEGSGVGLAIVKRIMEKHNARIWYESDKGNGTIFYLSFQKDKS